MEMFENPHELLKKKLQKISQQQDFLSQEIKKLEFELKKFENNPEIEIAQAEEEISAQDAHKLQPHKPDQSNVDKPFIEKKIDSVFNFKKENSTNKK